MHKFIAFTLVLSISVFAHCLVGEYNRAVTLYELQKKTTEILEQQIADMESTLNLMRSLKTYEDGFRDAMLYKDETLYAEGYHRGLQHGNDHANVHKFTTLENQE